MAAGLDVSELRDPGRHLIVRGRDTQAGEGTVGDIEFVIVRPSDAPAFVGCGGADCGICGWDSLIEADLNLLQLVDLGYGLCTFIEAEPAWRAGQAEHNYARRGSLRVATKYPRIASAWYAERGVNADIVSLHGNIELGPIVGMTDRIVDITARQRPGHHRAHHGLHGPLLCQPGRCTSGSARTQSGRSLGGSREGQAF